MDKDCSNSCNWHEFQEAAKLVRFHGNLAGAWLALDSDCSGSISLKEVDPEAHECLTNFKTWADAEFGGVRSAFKVLDADGSGSLNFKEFKSACRMYGFTGECKSLFHNLDQMGKGSLQLHEVSFLDNWPNEDLASESEFGSLDDGASSRRRYGETGDRLLEYFTENPGPGAYAVPNGFGVSDRSPGRYCGAFTMQGRHKPKEQQKYISPAQYSPCMEPTSPSKPAWTFSRRPKSAQKAQTPRVRRPSTPGPGSYDTCKGGGSPVFTVRPRRALPLHPSATPRQVFM